LAPFLTLYLCLAQVKDGLTFIPVALKWWGRTIRWPRFNFSLVVTKPRALPNWLGAPVLTLTLLALAVIALTYTSFLFGRVTRNHYEAQLLIPSNLPTTKERYFAPPATIKLATGSAAARLDETEIRGLAAQAATLTPLEKNLLTQTEALNYALAFYYLGDEPNYLAWLQLGINLDPNSGYLKL
jgi:hypothetical protein